MPVFNFDCSSRRAAKILGMFLLIVGAKFLVLRLCSSPLPVFDQWQAEGQTLLQPWLRGKLQIADLFAPWVQHRIVWTRLLVLGLFQVNGQWDTQVEAIAAAFLHAATAVLLAIILVRRLGRQWEDAVLLGLVLLFGLPFGQENTLSGGFASQYYFLLLFTVIAIWGLAARRPGTAGWWMGVASAVAAWFSVATGGLATLAVAAWLGLRLARREGASRENALALAVALALGVGGLSLSIGIEQQSVLQPTTLTELFGRFFGLLGWPNQTAWAAPVAFAPFAWLVWRTVRRGGGSLNGRSGSSAAPFPAVRQTRPAEAFLIPLGLFALLNTAALAYARNHYGGLGVSRYMDFLSVGALVNFGCVLLFLGEIQPGGTVSRLRTWLPAAIWLLFTGVGLSHLTTGNLFGDLQFVRTCGQHEVENVASFVAQPDVPAFVRKDAFDVMCERPAVVAALLQDPQIRAILPWQVRSPVILEAASASPDVHQLMQDARDPGRAAWLLLPGHAGRPTYFRSRTITGLHQFYLRFPVKSSIGDVAAVALVEDRSGAVTWLAPDPQRTGWQWVQVKTPATPFHVEAVIAAGSKWGVIFGNPREVGRLSAWVEPLLDGSIGCLFAGLGVWLAALYWPRSNPLPARQVPRRPLDEIKMEPMLTALP